jgi:hypothetical protein
MRARTKIGQERERMRSDMKVERRTRMKAKR